MSGDCSILAADRLFEDSRLMSGFVDTQILEIPDARLLGIIAAKISDGTPDAKLSRSSARDIAV